MNDKLRLFCESLFIDWGTLGGEVTYRRNPRLYIKKSHEVMKNERKKISKQAYQIMWDDEILKTIEVEADVLPNMSFNPLSDLPDRSEDFVIAKKLCELLNRKHLLN